jgi:hypothetical protein
VVGSVCTDPLPSEVDICFRLPVLVVVDLLRLHAVLIVVSHATYMHPWKAPDAKHDVACLLMCCV